MASRTRLVIVGENRAEFVDIKTRELDKEFVVTRGQAYKINPAAFRRCDMVRNGQTQESIEIVVFSENRICPHWPGEISYDQDSLLMEADIIKQADSPSLFGKMKSILDVASSAYSALLPFGTLIIVGLILAWAFLFGGGQRWRSTYSSNR